MAGQPVCERRSTQVQNKFRFVRYVPSSTSRGSLYKLHGRLYVILRIGDFAVVADVASHRVVLCDGSNVGPPYAGGCESRARHDSQTLNDDDVDGQHGRSKMNHVLKEIWWERRWMV